MGRKNGYLHNETLICYYYYLLQFSYSMICDWYVEPRKIGPAKEIGIMHNKTAV